MRWQISRAQRRWPLLLTPLDTSGEKVYEEFVGHGESAHEIGLANLLGVRHGRTAMDQRLVQDLQRIISGGSLETSKGDIVAAIAAVIPNFHHVETGKDLDQRM